jgi:Domain of unknown function (DUF4189)
VANGSHSGRIPVVTSQSWGTVVRYTATTIILGMLMIGGAEAQVCQTVCSNYIEGECSEHTTTCSTPSRPTASWGAIAYSRATGSYGYSYSWGSQSKAESVAVQNCTKNAKDCEATVWFNHRCGAVSSDPGPTAFWGLGNTVSQARAAAQSQCMKGGRKGCEVQVSACSN